MEFAWTIQKCLPVQRQLTNKGQAWGVGNGFSSFYY
jgi:hypothetical protein